MKRNMSAATTTSTYGAQSSLPKLPVPSLDHTCSLYLQTLKPLLTPKQLEHSISCVNQFKSNMGPVLQERLQKRAQEKPNWLIEWWNEYAYMAFRGPTPINVSYFFLFSDDKLRRDPASRAASLIRGALLFRQDLQNEVVKPDSTRDGPLCMDQYRYLFNSHRIPTRPSDTTRTSTSDHIVVIRKNQYFAVDIKVNGKLLTSDEIEQQLRHIYANAWQREDGVGLLTADNRDTWTDARKRLKELNHATLEKIETCAFVVCLDDKTPITHEEASWHCMVGGPDRWFDASIQLIVFDNGRAGFNGEHSMMDATPVSRMWDSVLTGIDRGTLDLGTASGNRALPKPEKLPFTIDAPLKATINTAAINIKNNSSVEDLRITTWNGYGKNTIKKFGFSPDAFTQMVIQLAYYKMNGFVVPTYESAQTKKYLYGRTEVCRTVCEESKTWVEAMQDPKLDAKTKGQLGRAAVKAQSAYMQKAVQGMGVDRHLLGLKLLLQPGEKAAIFEDPAYAMSGHWRLSTSQVTSEYYTGYGWGQVVDDGWGVAYMVKNESLQFNIVSKFLGTEVFRHYLLESCAEMKQVFEASMEVKAKL